MWTVFTVERMDFVSAQWFLPICLLVNYSLAVYLLVAYWRRRAEWRVRLLLAVGWLSALVLIPYARSSHEKVTHLNDISESCGVLTFLIQITIVGRDLNKKIKFPSVLRMTYVAEGLITVDLFVVLATIADVLDDRVLPDKSGHLVLDILENINLVFIFLFRFYCIAAANGWRDIVTKRRGELVSYVLFATSDVPFVILDAVSGLVWDAPKALYNRLTIAACLVMVMRAKIRKDSSAQASVVHEQSVSTLNFGRRTQISAKSSRSKPFGQSVSELRMSRVYVATAKPGDSGVRS
jgi:hypothetical protein